MKTRTLIFLVFFIIMLSSLTTIAQTLEVNEVDEFTKKKVKKTSFETLYMWKFTAFYRISRVDSREWLDLKIVISGVFSIDKDAEFMLKLNNGEIVTLKNSQYAITCSGCGSNGFLGSQAQGLKTSYLINEDQHKLLRDNKVVKVRIYTNDGFVEGEVKDKSSVILQKSLKLIED